MIRYIKSQSFLLLILITFLGFGLRFLKIGFGLPDITFSNEEITCYPTLNMISQGFNPRHFIHPNFYYYLWVFFDLAFIVLSLALGNFKTPYDAWVLYKTDPTPYFLIGRSIAAILGTATIPLTYLIGKRIFNEKTGIIGAFFMSIGFIHVQWSQIAYMDVPLTFFIALAFIFSLKAYETQENHSFILAGIFSGLACSTKYHGAPCLVWGPLAVYLAHFDQQKNPLLVLGNKKTLLFFFSALLGFTIGTPFWILDFPEFKRQFLMMTDWFRPHGGGHIGIQGDWNWRYYLFTTLPYSVGLPVFLAGISGLFLLFFRMTRRILFFLSYPLLYFAVAGVTRICQAKYMMSILPFFSILAAFSLMLFIENFVQHKKPWPQIALILISLAVGLPSFVNVVRYNYLKNFPDTRRQAIDWVDQNIPPQSKLLVSHNTLWHRVSRGPQFIDLDPSLNDQKRRNESELKSLEEYQKQGFDYLVLDEWQLGRLFITEASNPRFRETIKRYQQFLSDLKENGHLIATFSPYRNHRLPYDRENDNYASRSLWKLKSFGPWIEIYQLDRIAR